MEAKKRFRIGRKYKKWQPKQWAFSFLSFLQQNFLKNWISCMLVLSSNGWLAQYLFVGRQKLRKSLNENQHLRTLAIYESWDQRVLRGARWNIKILTVKHMGENDQVQEASRYYEPFMPQIKDIRQAYGKKWLSARSI